MNVNSIVIKKIVKSFLIPIKMSEYVLDVKKNIFILPA